MRDILIFDFFQKALEVVYPSHFVYDFLRKLFLMLYSINWPNLIALFSLLLELLGNLCIVIAFSQIVTS